MGQEYTDNVSYMMMMIMIVIMIMIIIIMPNSHIYT